MKLFHRLPVFSLVLILSCATASARLSLTNIKERLFPKPVETHIETSYFLGDNSTIDLKNNTGDIEIYYNDQQKDVTVQITKQALKEDLAKIHLPIHLDNNKLSLETICDNPIKKSCVHYKIGIPKNGTTNLYLTNKKGKIAVNGCTGKVTTKNGYGNITITDASDTIDAKISKRGNIKINKPYSHITADTNQGNIEINQSGKSVIAKANRGNIRVHVAAVPDDTKIKLKNNRGNIFVTLPEDLHAKIRASSTKGKVTCQHAVTLNPNTTALDPAAWEHFKQSIHGTIGEGKSQIIVHSEKSNITINKEQKKA